MKKVKNSVITAVTCTAGMFSLLFVLSAAKAQENNDQFPEYQPAANIIKCPYIPEDMFEIPSCQGLQATCVGTDSRDLIIGTEGDDIIVAGEGNDVVHADAGDDIVCGGPGDDSLFGARGDDSMFGEDGNDWIFGAIGEDLLDGGPGDFDVVWGGPGFDSLDGGPGESDICMLQREMGTAHEGCNSQYPPPGYVHEEDPEPGLLKIGKVY